MEVNIQPEDIQEIAVSIKSNNDYSLNRFLIKK